MNKAKAEELAIGALAWIAADDERAAGLLGISGASPEDLAQQGGNPDFLAFVVDFVLMDDQMVISCADELGVKPEAIVMARHYLPGGDVPEWT